MVIRPALDAGDAGSNPARNTHPVTPGKQAVNAGIHEQILASVVRPPQSMVVDLWSAAASWNLIAALRQ